MKDVKIKDVKMSRLWTGFYHLFFCSSFIFSSFIVSPGAAGETTFLTQAQLAPHEKTVARVEEYLSGLTTIVSDFTQVAPDGTLTTGTFYLKRPGMMRWQYNPPTPVLMVSDGKQFVFYDYDLQQVTYLPLDGTVLAFLAQPKIRFTGKIAVTSFEEKGGIIRIGMANREKPGEGDLTLEFSDSPLQIESMIVTDATQQITTVSLDNAKFGVSLDKKLFDFKDPRGKKYR